MNDTEKKGKPNSKRFLIIKLVLTVAVLLVLFWKFDFIVMLETIKSANPIYIFTSIFCLFAQTYLIAWRWQLINIKTISIKEKIPGFLTHWHYLMISFWFNLALPSSVGGDAVRIWTIKRVGIPLSQAANSVILDRISALLAVVILIGCGLPFLASNVIDLELMNGLILLIILAVFGVLFLVNCEMILKKWCSIKVIQILINLSRQSKTIFANPTIISSAILIHLITIISFYCILMSLSVDLKFSHLLLIMPTVILLSALPISISGWGVREGSLVVGLGIFSVDASIALTASILFGLSSIMIGICGGIAWIKDKNSHQNLTCVKDNG